MLTSIGRSWFVRGMAKATSDIGRKGWGEQQGSISLRLLYEDIEPYQDLLVAGEKVLIGDRIPGVGGQYYLFSTSDNSLGMQLPSEKSQCLLRVSPDGDSFKIMWGDHKRITLAHLSSHLRAQDLRQQVTLGANRAMLRCDPTNLGMLASLLELSPAVVTRALWEMSPECVRVCPDGVGVMPTASPESNAVGIAAANALRKHRLAIWPLHGIFAAGATLDEAILLVATADKAAEILVRVLSSGGPKQFVKSHQLRSLAESHRVSPFPPALDLDAWFTTPREGSEG